MQLNVVSVIQYYALFSNGLVIMICVPRRVRKKILSSTTIYVSFSLLKGATIGVGEQVVR